ncbi:MAG: alpha/beta hydrolase [Gammaproteobacteria bacterium]|nr:alpha/beta hydrolase [Gammaproteobacteria bacterium]MDH3535872.1 alpha/beta hydrolase [Gammaproteobacteria bacterium]
MTKTALVLIPGLLCNDAVWASQVHRLAPDFDIQIPDLRNFDSLEAMGKSVLHSAPPHFHVAGHSMGGRVAFEIVRLAPERVQSLILLDTGVHPVTEAEPGKRQVYLDLAEAQGILAVAREWIPPMIHPERRYDRELIDSIVAMVTSYSVEQFKGQINALLNRRDMNPLLSEIECPTLVACGREDGWATLAQHEAIAAAIRGAELSVIENSGHMVSMEQPAAVTSLLVDWLTRH